MCTGWCLILECTRLAAHVIKEPFLAVCIGANIVRISGVENGRALFVMLCECLVKSEEENRELALLSLTLLIRAFLSIDMDKFARSDNLNCLSLLNRVFKKIRQSQVFQSSSTVPKSHSPS